MNFVWLWESETCVSNANDNDASFVSDEVRALK
jgi:hypothetical protein